MDKRAFVTLILLMGLGLVGANEPEAEQPKIPEILLEKVAQGDAETAFFIGNTYLKGEGNFSTDLEQAKKWFKKAAEMDHPHGMFEFGLMQFFDKEFESAHGWFEKAAKKGHAESFYRMGNYHVYGYDDRPVDCQSAYQLFDEAQKRGVDVAYNDHAWMLATLPEKSCRNGEKAWRLMSQLESSMGGLERMPLSYIDTKAAVLAEISEFNEAIATQGFVVEAYCGLYLDDFEDNESWMAASAKQPHDFCPDGVARLRQYMARKPWREKPVSTWLESAGADEDE